MALVSYQTNRRVERPLTVSATISTGATYTDELEPRPQDTIEVSVSGTFVGIVTLQRKLKGAPDYVDWFAYDEKWEATIFSAEEGTTYRIGFKAGDFVSGSALCRISW